MNKYCGLCRNHNNRTECFGFCALHSLTDALGIESNLTHKADTCNDWDGITSPLLEQYIEFLPGSDDNLKDSQLLAV